MPAPGETDLAILLASLDPLLDDETYVFLSVSPESGLNLQLLISSSLMTLQEAEGVSLVVPLRLAVQQGLCDPDGQKLNPAGKGFQLAMPCRRITLRVQSSLDAVGMMAAIAQRLTDRNLSCNVVAGFMHDHLLVPVDQASGVMAALHQLQRDSASST